MFVPVLQLSKLVADCEDQQPWMLASAELISQAFVECSTYGPPYKRDQRVVSGINSFIAKKGADLPVNLLEGSDHLVHATVRSAALGLIFSLARFNGALPVGFDPGANPLKAT